MREHEIELSRHSRALRLTRVREEREFGTSNEPSNREFSLTVQSSSPAVHTGPQLWLICLWVVVDFQPRIPSSSLPHLPLTPETPVLTRQRHVYEEAVVRSPPVRMFVHTEAEARARRDDSCSNRYRTESHTPVPLAYTVSRHISGT